jgi:hypothetical protein
MSVTKSPFFVDSTRDFHKTCLMFLLSRQNIFSPSTINLVYVLSLYGKSRQNFVALPRLESSSLIALQTISQGLGEEIHQSKMGKSSRSEIKYCQNNVNTYTLHISCFTPNITDAIVMRNLIHRSEKNLDGKTVAL